VIMRFYSDFKKSKGQEVRWHDVQGNLKTSDGKEYQYTLKQKTNFGKFPAYLLHTLQNSFGLR
jgi:hypothetical protein